MTEDRPPGGDDLGEAVADAMGHPVQGRILMILAESGSKSAQEISAEIHEPADRIRYHLRQLRSRGLIESSEQRARRGVIERFYRSVTTPVVEDATYEALSGSKKMRMAVNILKAVFADTSRALRTGAFERRVDHITRMRLRVDGQGWKELLAIHRTAWKEVERVKIENDERLDPSADDCFWVTSAQLCFECPPSGQSS
jgi:DNA-binding transcriptional ArsR family regulator